MFHAFSYLLLAITFDIIANVFLKKSDRFHRKMYGVPALFLAVAAFSCLMEAIKTMELSTAYAIWGGLGLFATTTIDSLFFKETIHRWSWLGLTSICCGVGILIFKG